MIRITTKKKKKGKQEEVENFKELEPIEVNIAKQNESDYRDYALYVLANRTIPTIYGFKPVQLRLLWCMYNDDKAIKKTVKCAKIVGSVLGKYHPHGDVAAYKALLPMTSWYDCYIPLIKKQGNFGSFQGAGPASYRYTEAGLNQFCLDCIIGELKDTTQVVNWEKNYDESMKLPVYLPIKVPILMINGTDGIGVGVKVDIPPHNINEVIDATLTLLRNPNAKIVLRPDQCMPCEIVDTDWKVISNTGQGSFTVRGKVTYEEYHGYPALVINSIPNGVRLNPIKQEIDKLKENNILPQVIDILEESRTDSLRCIIKLKKGTDTNYVKQMLYQKTSLQTTKRVNFEVYDPVSEKLIRFSYKSYLQFFINFRKGTLARRFEGLYQDASTRMDELESYIALMKNSKIDEIISLIRHNKTKSDVDMVEMLIKKYKLTDLQAWYIVRNRLIKVGPVYLKQYEAEYNDLAIKAKTYYELIVNENKLVDYIEQELITIKQAYGCPRRSRIISKAEAENIPEGVFQVIISEKGYIRKIPEGSPIGSFRDDKPKYALLINNASNLIVFDQIGKMYKLQISKLPIYDKRSNGTDIRIILKKLTANIAAVIPEDVLSEYSKKIRVKYYLVCVTKNGLIKKLELEDLLTVPVSGFFYMKLDTNDFVQDVMVIPDNADVVVYSNTKALRFPMEQVPLLKRITKGNIAMKSEVDGISVIKDGVTDLVVVTNNGYFNRLDATWVERSNRARAGSRVIKLHKGDFIKYIFGVNANDIIKVVTPARVLDVKVSDLTASSTIAVGDKVLQAREIVVTAVVEHNTTM